MPESQAAAGTAVTVEASAEKCRIDKHNDVGVNCAEYLLVKNIYQQVKIVKK